jgi:hypothetical protein
MSTLNAYQRDIIAAARAATKHAEDAENPTSPRLEPLGSPGEVMTPLILNESAGGYFLAGAREVGDSALRPRAGEAELLEGYIRRESQRK